MKAKLVPLLVRMPERLRADLARKAKAQERSLNAEITDRLQKSLKPDKKLLSEAAQLVAELLKRASLEAYNRGISMSPRMTTLESQLPEIASALGVSVPMLDERIDMLVRNRQLLPHEVPAATPRNIARLVETFVRGAKR